MRVYLGSYGRRILTAERDPATGALSDPAGFADLPNPSWLERHPTLDVVYAVSETADGEVAAFAGDGSPLGRHPTHGADPCHIAIDPDGRRLVVANYTGGSISVHPLEPDGALGAASRVEFFGAKAHAHQCVFRGDRVAVNDLGNDQIRWYTTDFCTFTGTATPPGSGPRHTVFGSDGRAFLTAELSGQLLIVEGDSVSAVDLPGGNAPSGLVLSPDGRFLYVANRGPDSISVFAVETSITPVAEVPCGGSWPRDITIIDGVLYAANQRSDDVAWFRLGDDGVPTPAGKLTVPSPSRVA